ncbi:MAG: hypothetical protein Q9164_000264 [Protoblastenia rupestris]
MSDLSLSPLFVLVDDVGEDGVVDNAAASVKDREAVESATTVSDVTGVFVVVDNVATSVGNVLVVDGVLRVVVDVVFCVKVGRVLIRKAGEGAAMGREGKGDEQGSE